jgi:hypothetical protein
MNKVLNNLSEVIAKANDLFYSKFETLDTLLGIMDKNLRKQGIKADAVTIDCVVLDKKIVILLHDDKPDVVSVALGNKAGSIHSSSEYALDEFSVESMLKIMERYFVVSH